MNDILKIIDNYDINHIENHKIFFENVLKKIEKEALYYFGCATETYYSYHRCSICMKLSFVEQDGKSDICDNCYDMEEYLDSEDSCSGSDTEYEDLEFADLEYKFFHGDKNV